MNFMAKICENAAIYVCEKFMIHVKTDSKVYVGQGINQII